MAMLEAPGMRTGTKLSELSKNLVLIKVQYRITFKLSFDISNFQFIQTNIVFIIF